MSTVSNFFSSLWQSWAGPYSLFFHRIFQAPPLLRNQPPRTRARLSKTVVFQPTHGGKTKKQTQAVILFCHDAHQDVDHLIPDLEEFATDHQVTVVAWEYPGYGYMRRPHTNPISEEDTTTYVSTPASPDQFKTEALAVFDSICNAKGPFVLLGTGYGNAFVMHIASQRPQKVSAIIMHRPFTSLSAITRQWVAFPKWLAYPWWLVEPNVFDNIACANQMASKYNGPVLLIHGKKEKIFPLLQAHDLADALKQFGNDRVHLVMHPDWDHTVDIEEVLYDEVGPFVTKLFRSKKMN